MALPISNSCYNSRQYWDQRFGDEETYDWLCGYPIYKDRLEIKLSSSDNILVLGCGNSQLSYHLYKAGFKRITNIDYSEIVIMKMKKMYESFPEMKWVTMDILEMEFTDSQFNVIIDKATLDAFLVDERDPWRVSDAGHQTMHTILSQVSRLLCPGGKFISITFAQPHFRKPLLVNKQYTWSINTETFGDHFHFFMYTMVKGHSLSDEDSQLLERHLSKRTESYSDIPGLRMEKECPHEFLNSLMSIEFD